MKSDTTTTVFNFLLAVVIVLGMIFMCMVFVRTHNLQILGAQAESAKNELMRVESLGNEIGAYYQKNPTPELKQILVLLQPGQPRTANH